MEKIKTAFFGSSVYSLPYLESLAHNPFIEIVLVVSQPDKKSGRGFKETATPTKQWSQNNKILVLTPLELTDPLFLGALKTLPLNLGLSAYYGLKIPKEVIGRFPLGILNVHHSLLPKHRGPNPIPWTILFGDKMTGTSLIEIDEKFDAGKILAQSPEEVRENDTTGTLRARLDQKAITLLEETLPRFVKGEVESQKTVIELGSYEGKITKEMGMIDWSKSDGEIERLIRALDPWPGAWTMLGQLLSKLKIQNSKFKIMEKRVKILKTNLDENKKLVIEEVQIEGKKAMGWKEFLSGYGERDE